MYRHATAKTGSTGGSAGFLCCVGIYVILFFFIVMFIVRGVNDFYDDKEDSLQTCKIQDAVVVANNLTCEGYIFVGTSEETCGDQFLISTNNYDCYDNINNETLIYQINETVNCLVYDCNEQLFTIDGADDVARDNRGENGLEWILIGVGLLLIFIVICICIITTYYPTGSGKAYNHVGTQIV